MDGLNSHRLENVEVKINNIPIGKTNKAGVVMFEVTNCTTLNFAVDNLKNYEPFQFETQIVLPTAIQLNIQPITVRLT